MQAINALFSPTGFHEDVASEATAVTALAPRPRTCVETGLSENLLQELIVKHLHNEGVMELGQLASRCALPGPVLDDIVAALRKQSYVEVRGAADHSGALRFALTDRGRVFAMEALMRDGYVGPAPVPLAHYAKIIEAQTVHGHQITREAMHKAFATTTIRAEILDQLGAALNSGRATFVYGPAGSGKTYMCQRLARMLGDPVLIPHAIAVGDTAVRLFDPVVHHPVESRPAGPELMLQQGSDPRFVLCRRPAVITGGELTLDMLEIRYDAASRQHHAPLQLKATNGIYLLDDLGRQRVATVDVFNRWIVPLESKQDFLSLASGARFPVPFDLVLVFSTNVDPAKLADEAFLRRIGHKVQFAPLTPEEYTAIWRQVCGDRGIEFDPGLVRYVLDDLYPSAKRPLLACHPRDLLGMALDQARYLGGAQPTPELLRSAWKSYFVDLKAGDD
ncbi:MAG: AAA family ATPase [Pseudomonadota bacterium]|nr:AAA family ATPase [Pseudomonadota bacterium]